MQYNKCAWLKGALLLLFSCMNSYTAMAAAPSSLQSIINAKENTAHIEIKTAPPIKTNTQTYGLAFIFSATCPHCLKFAPTLEAFAATTELPVYPFSVDGKGIHTYDKPLIATPDIMREFFPNQADIVYPALFLVNLNTRKHVPLSLGNVPFNVLDTTYRAAITYPHIQSRLSQ